MRALARKPALPPGLDAIDIVGTGGDASGSLNLSTGAALLAAACGLPVVKHGNRSVSSRSGSADLLEQLGFTLPLDETRAARCFAATGFTFLFAPYFHPAMKVLAPIRAALGIRTVFNLLGPLTNPAAPRFRLIGAYDASTAELMAGTLAGMDIERAWVVHGAGGWDEATPIGPFLAFDVTRDAPRPRSPTSPTRTSWSCPAAPASMTRWTTAPCTTGSGPPIRAPPGPRRCAPALSSWPAPDC
jgi:anthranilate phosphoribosyltransferase